MQGSCSVLRQFDNIGETNDMLYHIFNDAVSNHVLRVAALSSTLGNGRTKRDSPFQRDEVPSADGKFLRKDATPGPLLGP